MAQLNGGKEYGTSLFQSSDLAVERAKAEMTKGQEGTHAEFLRQSDGLVVVGCSLIGLREIMRRGNPAEQRKVHASWPCSFCTPSLPLALPSANAPNSARHQTSQVRHKTEGSPALSERGAGVLVVTGPSMSDQYPLHGMP